MGGIAIRSWIDVTIYFAIAYAKVQNAFIDGFASDTAVSGSFIRIEFRCR